MKFDISVDRDVLISAAPTGNARIPLSTLARPPGPLLGLRQRDAGQLLVVAGDYAAIAERGMAPDDVSIECEAGRFQQLCATEFLIAVRGQVSEVDGVRNSDMDYPLLDSCSREKVGGLKTEPSCG